MNGSNAPRDGKKWGADVPRERRRFLAHLHRDFRPLAHPFGVRCSPHVPIESPRVARSDPEATGASHSRETKCTVGRHLLHQMFVLRWKHLLKLVFVTRQWLRPSAARLRPFSPFPAPVPVPVPGSSQIVFARWYVLTRRPPRQSNAANRLFRSATHPVATSTKRYIDVHNAVNCTAAKKAQKLHPS